MKLRRFWTLTHKWIGLVVGVQVILWMASGIVMTWFPIEEIRSEHRIREADPIPLTGEEDLIPLAQVLSGYDDADSVVIRRLEGVPVYEIRLFGGNTALHDGATGRRLTPLDANIVKRIAVNDFAGEAVPGEPQLIEAHNSEYRGDLPAWRVAMGDEGGTRLYISPSTGEVLARRSAIWRLYDFFWMLHIMDYEDRTDFNHPLVIGASIVGFGLAVSGLLLLFYRFTRRDFRWLTGRRK